MNIRGLAGIDDGNQYKTNEKSGLKIERQESIESYQNS